MKQSFVLEGNCQWKGEKIGTGKWSRMSRPLEEKREAHEKVLAGGDKGSELRTVVLETERSGIEGRAQEGRWLGD